MNITIIYGSMSKSNSYYNFIQLLLDNFKSNIALNITEIYSSNDISYFYGRRRSSTTSISFSHLYDNNNIQLTTKSLYKADLIIIACTTFTCDLSNEMKCFLNNLSYYYLMNKDYKLRNNKIGLIISTASGGGLFHITKLIKKNMSFWGIHNIFNFSQNIYEGDWEYLDLKTKKQIAQKLLNISYKILWLHNKNSRSQAFTTKVRQALVSPAYNLTHHKKVHIFSKKYEA